MKYNNKSWTTPNNIGMDGFECTSCGAILNIDELLSKYGPEGLYELADLLKQAADEDVADSMNIKWEN